MLSVDPDMFSRRLFPYLLLYQVCCMKRLNPNTKTLYDRFSCHYDHIIELLTGVPSDKDPPETEIIDQIFSGSRDWDLEFDKSHDWILELGSGTGRVTIPLVKRGYKVIGIDISDEMSRFLKRKLTNERTPGQFHLLSKDLRDLDPSDLGNRSVGVVLSNFSFLQSFSCQEQKEVLRALQSLLRNNGHLIAFDAFQVYWESPDRESHSANPYLLMSKVKLLEDEYVLLDEYLFDQAQTPNVIQVRKIYRSEGSERNVLQVIMEERYLVQPPFHFVLALQDAGFSRFHVLDQHLNAFTYGKEMIEQSKPVVYFAEK